MRDITLSETTVAQSCGFDEANEWIYVAQLIQGGRQFPDEPAPVSSGDRSTAGDISINRLYFDGSLESNMYVRGAGHGLSCQPVQDGRLWIDADASGGGFARALSLVDYVPGALYDSDTLPTHRPFGAAATSHGLSCSVDVRFGKFAVRRNFPDGDPNWYRHYLYTLSDALVGEFSNVLATVDQRANEAGVPGSIGTSQGFATYGDYMYSLEGDPELNNTYISRLDWATGSTQQHVLMDIMPDITYREPEGLSMLQYAHNPNINKLMFGFASGPGGGRKYNLNYIPAVT